MFALRKFDMEKCDPLEVDDISLSPMACFGTKKELFAYCALHNITLGIEFEFDTSWHNFARNL